MRLLDLFPNLTATWPSRFSRDAGGFDLESGPEIPAFVAELSAALNLEDVVFGASGTTRAVEAKVRVTPATGDHIPIVDGNLPELTFKLLPTTGAFAHVRIAVTGTGPEPARASIVIDGLAVSIAFSIGTLMPPLPASGPPIMEKLVGTFVPGQLDSFAVAYRDSAASEISVHLRVTVDPDGAVTVVPAVPIVIGPCRFLGLPVQGIYDLTPILSPERARDHYEWIVHRIDDPPLLPVPTRVGLLAMRQLILDPTAAPLKGLWDRLNDATSNKDPEAELVLEDLVLPMGIESWRAAHYRIGIRRKVVDVHEVRAQHDFATAPIRLALVQDPPIGGIVNYLALRSTGEDNDDRGEWPIAFEAAFFLGTDAAPRHAAGLSIEERKTGLVTYLRSLQETDTEDTGADDEDLDEDDHIPGLDFKLFGLKVSIAAVRIGWSFENDGDFLSKSVLAADLVVRDTESKNQTIRLEGLDAKPVSFTVERAGWWFGPSAELPALPDGLQIVLFDSYRAFLQEIALVGHPNGGHYIAASFGFDFKVGKASVRRMRFKIGGNADAAAFGVDGFFFALKTQALEIEAGGSFIDEDRGDYRIKEFAFTGTAKLSTEKLDHTLGIDVLVGEIDRDVGDDDWYFLASAVVQGKVPVGALTLHSVRALGAHDMRPKLDDSDLASRELRYLAWSKRTNPTSVGGDRRLAGWEANHGSWAIGIGAGGNVTPFGEACRLDGFLLLLEDEGRDSTILFISLDVFLLNNLTKPIAYLALEVPLGDCPNISAIAGVDVGPDQFVTDPPDWLREIARISATIFLATDPATLAIGRLDDPRTWATLRVRHQIFGAEGWFEVQLCLELSRDAKGFAFALRVGGTATKSIFHFDFYLGLGVIIATFTTGSTVEGHCFWAEAGMAFRLWSWFRFSCKADIEVRGVGQDPSYSLASMRIRIETPWYLPDVTFKYSWSLGQLTPAELAALRGPLLDVSAFDEGTGTSYRAHLTPFDPGATTDRDRLRSVAELRAVIAPPRHARVAAAFDGATALAPVPTDVTIQLAFAIPVTDAAGIASPVPQLASDQTSGDLTLSLELIGMTIRRRPRFDSAAAWVDLCDRVEMAAILDGNGGVTMGALEPLAVSALWEPVLVDGKTAGQRLLINSTTPFSFGTWDPNADEELAEAEPGWPCCTPDRAPDWPTHELAFAGQALGDPLPASLLFPATRTALHAGRAADVRVSIHAGGTLPAGTRAARWSAGPTGVLARIVLDKPAAWLDVYLAWPAQVGGAIVLTALDDAGEVLQQRVLPLGTTRPPERLRMAATRPLSSVIVAVRGGLVIGSPFVELTRASYVVHADLQLGLRRQLACKGADHAALSGQGKLGFLPNHEYEIELRSRLAVGHPSASTETVETTEFAYFRTKGIPGLNAVAELGSEVRPHVTSQYPDAGAPLYRDESVVIGFDELYSAVVPLASRPPRPTSDERDFLLELELTLRPAIAIETGTPFTASAPDWLTTNRTVASSGKRPVWRDIGARTEARGRKDVSRDPRRLRLAALLARPEACNLADPRVAPSSVLVAPPPDDPALGTDAWPAQTHFEATIAPKGGPTGPFVHREAFDPADVTAFRFASDSSSISSAAWSVNTGVLVRAGTGRQVAVLGTERWNHFAIDVALTVGEAPAGIALALPHAAAGATRGLFALIEREGASAFLALRRRTTPGGALQLLERTPITVGTGPIPLAVTAFDDRVRAQVGQVVIEADRDELRDGCLGLVTDGPASFHTLAVTGLPMYRFPVEISRYRSFGAHIASYSGVLGEATPESMGLPPVAPSTVATLFAATQARIARAMANPADSASRDALFAEWVAALALPLRTAPSGVELTRYVLGDQTRLLLLESPEPLRFTHEVTVGLVRLGNSWDPPDWLDDLHGTLGHDRIARLVGPTGDVVGTEPLPLSPLPPFPVPPPTLVVLTDGPQRRALLIPVRTGAAVPLLPGRWRLELSLERMRWREAAPASPASRLSAAAAITVAWT